MWPMTLRMLGVVLVFIGYFSCITMFRHLPSTSALLKGRRLFGMSDFSRSLRPSTQLFSTSPKAKSSGKKKEAEGKYSKTIFLLNTTFDQRANSLVKEPELQKWWKDNRIYERLAESNPGEKFLLHDGPPYANGDLHIGHALNKILKDIINRYQILQGRKVRFVPGWDCHGLPIEMKVLQNISSSERENLTPTVLRKRAADFASETMASQRESFKRYGVWGDWDAPYLTLQKEYEAAQIKVFGDMVLKGYIYRGLRPVHWSPSSRTALAEAELEYPDNHQSRSVYIAFPMTQLSSSMKKKLNGSNDPLAFAVWTTTPWTITANSAICVNGQLNYSIVSHPAVHNGTKLVVASALVESFESKMGIGSNTTHGNFVIHAELSGSDLEGSMYGHPFANRESQIYVGGDYITSESGTGLVHTAPGHGHEDFATGQKLGLELRCPVDDLGRFTSEAGPELEGKSVLSDGNVASIELLKRSGHLLKEEAYNHKYPYDWRTKKPVIFRLTEQWFASVSSYRSQVIDAINSVEWIPAVGKNRIQAMIESRSDWCISRQRTWGVPIPVFYHRQTRETLMNKETLDYIQELFKIHGSDCWWNLSVEELLPPSYRSQAHDYVKGEDTMDVWFDSGTSWAGVCQSREGLKFPADLYLEGSDQHRGWFQSSLLTAMASQGMSPYRQVLTHGFVLDEQGKKMSKSLGNVIDPKIVIEGSTGKNASVGYGADTLRLWVAGVDYADDVCIGEKLMKQTSDNYRKFRNVLRFLVGSIHDFDPQKHAVSYDALPSIDRYLLGKLSKVMDEVEGYYNVYQFYRVIQELALFTSIDLSAFYLDTSKDRLYVSRQDDFRRRSSQTVVRQVLELITVALAPVLPHLAEDLWKNLPFAPTDNYPSIFMRGWRKDHEKYPSFEAEKWTSLLQILNDVNKALEIARNDHCIGASMESRVVLYSKNATSQDMLRLWKGDSEILATSQSTNGIDDLRFIFHVSQVDVVDSLEELQSQSTYLLPDSIMESGVHVGVARARGQKCQRCWYYCTSVGHQKHSDLCHRCSHVITEDKLDHLISADAMN